MFHSELFFEKLNGSNILLLQGPPGPFFKKLASILIKKRGLNIYKINFNGGDAFFYPCNAVQFRSPLTKWPDFLDAFVKKHNIDQIVVFGDCRPIHKVARSIACKLNIRFMVFEEGYMRPNYITLEENGVNGLSELPTHRAFYDALTLPSVTPQPISLGNTFFHAAFWAIVYYLMAVILFPFFKYYQHHRPLNAKELYYWSKSVYIRYGWYKFKERGILKQLTNSLYKKYYLVPLQVYCDAQITYYSDYNSVDDFITDVINSFALHAPKDRYLVIKHHPMDRGYKNYAKHINQLSNQLGISERIYYIHDQHLPSLLDAALGVIVINSTVGLSALLHNSPVKTMGKAIYNIDGLTYQGSLDEFFTDNSNKKIDQLLYKKFAHYVITKTQINGNFYKTMKF